VKFYTKLDCEEWISARDLVHPDRTNDLSEIMVSYPEKTANYRLVSTWISNHLMSDRETLLWITEWGIWPSSEDWVLYDRMRQFNGGSRRLYEAPGHLFAQAEYTDFELFLRVALESGWGGWFLPQADVSFFFSHDEYFVFYARNQQKLLPVIDFFKTIPTAKIWERSTP
jgi:hypothetical protein